MSEDRTSKARGLALSLCALLVSCSFDAAEIASTESAVQSNGLERAPTCTVLAGLDEQQWPEQLIKAHNQSPAGAQLVVGVRRAAESAIRNIWMVPPEEWNADALQNALTDMRCQMHSAAQRSEVGSASESFPFRYELNNSRKQSSYNAEIERSVRDILSPFFAKTPVEKAVERFVGGSQSLPYQQDNGLYTIALEKNLELQPLPPISDLAAVECRTPASVLQGARISDDDGFQCDRLYYLATTPTTHRSMLEFITDKIRWIRTVAAMRASLALHQQQVSVDPKIQQQLDELTAQTGGLYQFRIRLVAELAYAMSLWHPWSSGNWSTFFTIIAQARRLLHGNLPEIAFEEGLSMERVVARTAATVPEAQHGKLRFGTGSQPVDMPALSLDLFLLYAFGPTDAAEIYEIWDAGLWKDTLYDHPALLRYVNGNGGS